MLLLDNTCFLKLSFIFVVLNMVSTDGPKFTDSTNTLLVLLSKTVEILVSNNLISHQLSLLDLATYQSQHQRCEPYNRTKPKVPKGAFRNFIGSGRPRDARLLSTTRTRGLAPPHWSERLSVHGAEPIELYELAQRMSHPPIAHMETVKHCFVL